MAEKVKSTGVTKQSGYLYYLDKNGNVSRVKMARGANKGGLLYNVFRHKILGLL